MIIKELLCQTNYRHVELLSKKVQDLVNKISSGPHICVGLSIYPTGTAGFSWKGFFC